MQASTRAAYNQCKGIPALAKPQRKQEKPRHATTIQKENWQYTKWPKKSNVKLTNNLEDLTKTRSELETKNNKIQNWNRASGNMQIPRTTD